MTTKKTKALFQIRDFDALDMLREYLDEFCDDWDIFFINLVYNKIRALSNALICYLIYFLD